MIDKKNDYIKFCNFAKDFAKTRNIKNNYGEYFKNDKSLRIIILGTTGSGKSWTCGKIINQIKHKYNKIIYFFGSTNSSLHFKDKKTKYCEITENFKKQIEILFKFQRALIQKKRKSRILLIVDDIQAHIKKCKSLFGKLTYCRHLGIDVIMLCQYYTMVPPLVRYQVSHSIFKKIHQYDMICEIYKNMSNFEFREKHFVDFVKMFQKNYRTFIINNASNNDMCYSN